MKTTFFLSSLAFAICSSNIFAGNGSSGGLVSCGNQNQWITCPASTGNSVQIYTGNERRTVEDLQVWGSLGLTPLNWRRTFNSRFVASTDYFGSSNSWRHSYQWEMTVSSDASSVTVFYPNGDNHVFTRVGSSNKLVSTPGISDILYQTDASTYTVQAHDGYQYPFKLSTGGAWQLASIIDPNQSVQTLAYDSSGRLSTISDAAGRYLKITYQVTNLNQANTARLVLLGPVPEGQWTTVTTNNNARFRYLGYMGADMTYSPVAEIKFFNPGGTQLSGTPFGSGYDPAGPTDYSKAFDGSTSSYFIGTIPSGDYAGIQLSKDSAVGSIQLFPRSGYASAMNNGHFFGTNIAPAPVTSISRVDTSDGRSVTYDYAVFNDPGMTESWETLTAAHYGDGTNAAYTYVQAFPLTRPIVSSAVDPRVVGVGTNLKWQYDNTTLDVVGYVTAELNGVTNEVMLTTGNSGGVPNKRDQSLTVTHSNGGTTTYNMGHDTALLNVLIDSLGRTSSYVYDQNGYGFLLSKTDPLNRTTTYTRSQYGNLLSITYPDNTSESWTRDSLDLVLTHTDQLNRTTTFTRDVNHRVARVDYPDGSFETFTYNAFSQLLTHQWRNGGADTNTYDSRGLKSSYANPLNETTTYTYDAYDRLAAETNPLGNTLSYQYNERGLNTKVTFPDASYASYSYNTNADLVSVTNQINNTWTATYDEFKRVTSSVDPLSETTTYSYDLPGGVCGCTHDMPTPTKITRPSGLTETIAYDTEWQRTSVTDGFGTVDQATTLFYHDAAGNVVRILNPLGKQTAYTYDTRDRRVSQTDALNNSTTWAFDNVGNTTSETRADRSVTSYAYDPMDKCTSVTDALGQRIQFSYDLASRLTCILNGRNAAYTFSYDLLNRRSVETFPDSSAQQWSFDHAGNLLVYTTRTNQTQTFVRDSQGRMTGDSWSDSTPSVSRTYDPAGRLIEIDNSNSCISYAYDPANRLISETQNISDGPGAQKVAYGYDVDGNRSVVHYPDGHNISYSFTSRGLLRGITEDQAAPLATYSYDLAGNRVTKALANGCTTSSSYDDDNRPIGISEASAGTVVSSLHYAYNQVNDRTSTQRETGLGDAYSYDAVNEVTGAQYDALNSSTSPSGASKLQSFVYDASGNRSSVSMNGIGATYATNDLDEYASVSGIALAYDAAGNLTERNDTGYSYSYDSQSRLTKVVAQNQPVAAETDCSYDGLSRCVKRASSSGSTICMIYEGPNVIEDHYRDSGSSPYSEQAYYIYGAKMDEVLAKGTSVGLLFYHQDAQQSTTMLSDSSGSIVERYKYDVFGIPFVYDGSGINQLSGSIQGNRFLFSGREWLPDAQVYNYRARVYAPDIGRFLQEDPTGFQGRDINLYRLAWNNPVNFTDPFGLLSGGGWSNLPIELPPVEAGPIEVGGIVGETGPPGWAIVGAGGAGFGAGYLIGQYGIVPFIPDPAPLPPDPNPNPSGLKPPGDCTWARYKELAKIVQDAKNVARNQGGADKNDTCSALQTALDLWQKVLEARDNLENECFRGDDHGRQDARNTIRNIKDKMKRLNCDCPSG